MSEQGRGEIDRPARVEGTPWARGLPVLATLLAGSAALYRVRTFDTMFHLAAGRYGLAQGELPAVDPFSFTVRGAPWINHSWGYQLLLARLHRLGGFAALSVLQAVIAAALMALALRSLRPCPERLPAGALLAALPYLLLREVLEARPHVMGFLCLCAIANQWARFRAEPRLSTWVPIALVYAAWATLHGSHVLVFPLLGLGMLGCALQRRWLAAAGVFACAITCATLGYWLAPQAFAQGSQHLASEFLESSVAEWQPLSAHDLLLTWPGAAFSATFGLTCAGVLLSLRGASWRAAREQLPELLMLAALMLLGLSSRRMLALFWFGAAPLWLPHAALALGRVRALATRPWLPQLLLGSSFGLALALPSAFQFGAGLARDRFPEQAVAAMRAAGRIRRVYNAYNFGGYLMYERYPSAGVFIDGRALTVYPEPFLRSFRRAYSDPALFDVLAQRYRIDGVLLARDSSLGAGLRAHLEQSGRWRRTHQDSVAEVYEPASP